MQCASYIGSTLYLHSSHFDTPQMSAQPDQKVSRNVGPARIAAYRLRGRRSNSVASIPARGQAGWGNHSTESPSPSSFLSLNDDILEQIISSALETTSSQGRTQFRTYLAFSHLSRRLRSVTLGRSIFWRYLHCLRRVRVDLLDALLERSRGITLEVRLENITVVHGRLDWNLLIQAIRRAETLTFVYFVVLDWPRGNATWLPATAPEVQSHIDRPLRELSMLGCWVPHIASLLGPQTTSLTISKPPAHSATLFIQLLHSCPNLRYLSLTDLVLSGIEWIVAPPPPWLGASAKHQLRFLQRVSIIRCRNIDSMIRQILLVYPQTARLAEVVVVQPNSGAGPDGAVACAELLDAKSGWEPQFRQTLVVTAPSFDEYGFKYLPNIGTADPFHRREFAMAAQNRMPWTHGPFQSAVARAMQDLTVLDIDMPLSQWQWGGIGFMDIWLGATWPGLHTLVLRSSIKSGSGNSFYNMWPRNPPAFYVSVPALQVVSIYVTRVEGYGWVDPSGIVTKQWASICWRLLANMRLDPDVAVIEMVSNSRIMTSAALQSALVAEQAAAGAVPIRVFAK